ncbi:DUF4838 domain-containing protein [Cohnella sp. GCM10020058]|uniref:DUF4838 domain-containing protein n=1 Tax=Cohnella sp. GCM10020058 TaxID=3317330 RepID=UPI003645C968
MGKNKLYKSVSRILIMALLISVWPAAHVRQTAAADTPEPHLTIVENGQAQAVIVVPDSSDANLQYAANLLKQYIKKSTNADLEVKSKTAVDSAAATYQNMVKIDVGFASAGSDPDIQSDLNGMTNDGYLIRPYDNGITIIGPTTWGTRFGASAFLERYLGVLWLMPGEDGEYVPKTSTVDIPLTPVREEPAFTEGVLYSGGAENQEWIDRNKRNTANDSNVWFSHNLYSLFPPQEFAATHPEIYPIINGQRKIPSAGQTTVWQPRFTEPITVSIAVYKIKAYFDANPTKTWFALGVNDSGGYSDEYIANAPLNSVGLPNLSDVYYQWVNDVVGEVVQDPKYQNKKFGLIAYDWVADPPSFDLDAHVVPFLTKDRTTWVDPGVETAGKSLNAAWSARASALGWYDYDYGLTYAIPRVYMHQMADNYQFGESQGVKYFFSELNPNWGEGPKPWVMAKLQWDPDLDVDELIDLWCERAVGAEAAPYLRQYYDYWEAFWSQDIPGSTWFETFKNGTYLHFYDASYLNVPTSEDMETSRGFMEAVLEKASTPEEKKRAQMLDRVFEYYEASVLSYPRTYDPIADESTALGYLADNGTLESALTMAVKRNQILDQEMTKKPPLFERDPRYLPAMQWNGLNSSLFFALDDYMKSAEPNGGPVVDRVLQLAKAPASSQQRDFARLLLKAWKDKYVIADPSFESGQPGELQAGDVWEPNVIMGGSGNSIRYDNIVAHTGSMSVKLENIGEAGPAQYVPVTAGLTTVSAYYYSPPGTQTRGSMVVICDLYDANKNLLKANFAYTGRKMFKDAAGEWKRAELLFNVPGSVNNVPVKYMRVYMDAYQLDDGVPAYIDDVSVYQGIDTSRLDALIDVTDNFLSNSGALHYTTNSILSLKAAVDQAKLLLTQHIADATQEEVETAAMQIDSAHDSLVLLPLTSEVEAFLSELSYDPVKSWAKAEGQQDGIHYDANAQGNAYSVRTGGQAQAFAKSVGAVAPSKLYYDLTGKGFEQFEAYAGIDQGAELPSGIAYSMSLGANSTYAETDVTTGAVQYGGDGTLSFKLSGNADGNNYFRTKTQAAQGQAPVLEITLNDNTTRTIVASENSQVVGGTSADTNYNADGALKSQLVVSRGALKIAYLKFDLNAAGLSAGDIQSVKLKLFILSKNSPSVQITAISNDNWSPSAITWNNQPKAYLQAELDADQGPIFRIYGDGKLLYESGAVGNRNQNAVKISVPINGVNELRLETVANGSLLADQAVWADAKFLTYTISDADSVADDRSALTWDVIRGENADPSSVTQAVYLPDAGAHGSTIAWSASPAGFLDLASGAVARPEGADQTVTLTAVVAKGASSAVKAFELTIPAAPSVFLSGASMGNQTVAGFAYDREDYTIVLPYGTVSVPAITVEAADPQATVEVTKANTLQEVTSVKVTASDGQKSKTYRFSFQVTTETEAIAGILHLIEQNESSGAIAHALASQLNNSLDQAESMRSKGKPQQAMKHLENFLKHLNNKGQQNKITAQARTALEADATAILNVWKR